MIKDLQKIQNNYENKPSNKNTNQLKNDQYKNNSAKDSVENKEDVSSGRTRRRRSAVAS